ncbi:uncharacterized protein LOC130451629 [Diorhabda sublineata]|uniref:uncharacterized protein LOC130451629 n=1 Tax=Diorhabda sublineata TaxID=1163346 RepID=UPI0024E10BF7|nr:uncharacterized protein LOC130451629 [Diorhabda sublineata]
MASNVEQAEIKTIGPLSSTLELFDSFKSQQEDKDSDEESFHLPLLSSDDDNEMDDCNGDILTSIPKGETENNILNKYETVTPETADAKEEHLLLHEGDGTDLNNTGLRSDQSKKNSEDSDVFKDMEIIDETDEPFEETKQIQEDNEGKEQISDSKSKAVESAKMNLNLDESEKLPISNSSDQYTCTADTGVYQPMSDSENKDSETIQSENDSQNPPKVDDISFGHEGEKEEISGDMKRNEESTSPVSTGKRSLIESDNDQSPLVNKKIRMSEEFSEENQTTKLDKRQALSEKESEEGDKTSLDENGKTNSTKNDKIKTLITFEKFMKQSNLGEGKLTRSDLEQFCLQKICEVLIHKTDTGELHQRIKKQEQIIESLRKDVQELSKQTRDLDIVNKKLMTELQSHNNNQKPIVPLKITRSVGLQVKLTSFRELISRRRTLPYMTILPRTPSTPVPPNAVNLQRNVQVNNSVIRQVVPTTPSTAPSPLKTPTTAPILTQALQIRPTPGVIDFIDEEYRTAKNVSQKSILNKNAGTPIKNVNKNGMAQNKASPKGTSAKGQSKTVAVGQAKTTPTGTKVGLQTSTVTTLPQGVRLTSAQMKNDIAIPASVVTSTAEGTTQLMYVGQPDSAGNSGTGVQKAVLLNFQPTTNGVLTSQEMSL